MYLVYKNTIHSFTNKNTNSYTFQVIFAINLHIIDTINIILINHIDKYTLFIVEVSKKI